MPFHFLVICPSIIAAATSLGLFYPFLFFFPKIVPILIFALYLGYRKSQTLDSVSKSAIFLGIPLFLMAILFFLVNPEKFVLELTGNGSYEWSWTALLTWMGVYNLSNFLCYRKTKNAFFSLTFTVLLVSASAWLYEVPYFINAGHSLIMFHYSFPFFLDTQIISLLFLFGLAYFRKWRFNKETLTAVLIYAVYFIIAVTNPRFTDVVYTPIAPLIVWIPRIVGAAVLLSLITGLHREGLKIHVKN